MPRSRLYLLALRDAVLASAAAFVGLPASSAIWRFSGRSVPASLGDLTRMSGAEWAILIVLFIVPAALLGAASGFALRRKGRTAVAVSAAIGTAFTTSLLGLSAFYWFLSNLL